MLLSALTGSEVDSLVSLQPEGWGDIRAYHHFYTSHDFCHPIKLMKDGELLGIGTGIIHGNVGWIAHIIVHRDHRNRGLGRLITQTVMDTLLKNGCRSLNLIATDLGAPVYEKLGFITDTQYMFFKEIKMSEAPSLPHIYIQPFEDSFLKSILELDNAASNEKREQWIVPHLAGAMVCTVDGHFRGHYFPTLGDGLVAATTDEAGAALMRLRLSTMDHACFPCDNLAAANLMTQAHATAHRVAKRMFYGDKPRWRPDFIFNRIGGNLG